MKKTICILMSFAGLLTMADAKKDVRAHWTMNDGQRTELADHSGNGNTLIGKNFAYSQGINSAAVSIKTDGEIRAENSTSLNPSDAITVEAWIRPWEPNFADSPTFVFKEGSYVLSFVPGKKVGIRLWLDGEEKLLSSKKTDWSKNTWYHIAATYDGTTMRLYVDGKLDAEVAAAGQLDASDSPLFIGSANGRHMLWNPIDEVRISGTALSADEINKTTLAGRFEAERMDARHAAFFHKGEKRNPKAVIPGYIWVDAEDFDEYGGWWMETQFVPQVGSPYMMAAGTGTPVADAKTTIRVESAGTYKLWVRNKNWLKDYQPGAFEVSVQGKKSKVVFGTEPIEEWVWTDGGTFELPEGDVELALHDLTGYYGRCDVLVLTKDMAYVPPFKLAGYKGEQRRLTGVGADETTLGDYDVVVVGAGVAGINAAVAAARSGAKTALIQNRPMIGGNNSTEMGVPLLGPADFGKKNAREAGLNEEAGRLRAYNFMQKWSNGAEVLVAGEENLTLFLNTHVYDVERTEGNRITAVRAFDMIDGHLTRYTGKQFVDATGDAWVGYYAGAELMRGREPRWMFNESNAPEEADIMTMSGALMHSHTLGYNSVDTGTPSPFDAPEWVWDLSFNTTNLQARNGYEGSQKSGTWWHENRNDVDDLWDPEAARDGLLRVSVSYWNWIKNVSSAKESIANRKLLPLPVTNAKRETVRLVGDYILKQDDLTDTVWFDDAIGHGGWGLDIHHIDGIFSTEGPFDFNTHIEMYNVPFRMLYSKNVPNLMMAGRNVSCTHVALGTVRVQGTTGIMGQAVGTAAAMCIDKGIDPRGIYQNHIKELQQQLLKDDQYIIGLKNEDPADVARKANVTASSWGATSSFGLEQVMENGNIHKANYDRAMMFRRGGKSKIGTVSVLLISANDKATDVSFSLRGSDAMGDFSSEKNLAVKTITVPARHFGWIDVEVNCAVESAYVWMMLSAVEGISWNLMDNAPLGSCMAYQKDDKWHVNKQSYYAFHLDEPIEPVHLYTPENVISGVARVIDDQMNMWASDPEQPLPQWIQLDLDKTKEINAIYLTFDTDVNDAKRATWEWKDAERMPPECVRDYQVLVKKGRKWVTVADVTGNYQRRRIHRFDAIKAKAVKVVVTATNGDQSARIYEVRAYNE